MGDEIRAPARVSGEAAVVPGKDGLKGEDVVEEGGRVRDQEKTAAATKTSTTTAANPDEKSTQLPTGGEVEAAAAGVDDMERDNDDEEEDDKLPMSKGKCIALVITLAGAAFLNVSSLSSPWFSLFFFLHPPTHQPTSPSLAVYSHICQKPTSYP